MTKMAFLTKIEILSKNDPFFGQFWAFLAKVEPKIARPDLARSQISLKSRP
jgi:hypothetical protein